MSDEHLDAMALRIRLLEARRELAAATARIAALEAELSGADRTETQLHAALNREQAQFDLLSDYHGWATHVCVFLTEIQHDERCYHVARSQAGYWRDRCPARPPDADAPC